MNSQYYIQPPNVPKYIYGFSNKAWENLMVWSYQEYRARLKELPKRGYLKELKFQSKEVSPYRVLAEMPGFRGLCAVLVKKPWMWNRLPKEQRDFIRKSFELRGHLIKSGALVH